MNSTSPLVRAIRSKRLLERAWRAIQENARSSLSADVRHEVDTFAERASANIDSISARLSAKSFSFLPAKGAPIPKKLADGSIDKSKIRPIVIAPVESRIVQRAILEILLKVEELTKYAENPYSFGGIRKGDKALAAVPAAINALLEAIGAGGRYVAFADIRSFFTRIPKARASTIIAKAVNDQEFIDFFDKAIAVELSNMAELKATAEQFPLSEIGVAQGNCLSPLIGNLILHAFDAQMNTGDCRCLRYIDDFIIIAPSKRAAKARMKKATEILADLGMELSTEKSSKEPISVEEKFTFLGVEIANGLLRPSRKARERLRNNIEKQFKSSIRSMNKFKSTEGLERKHSLIQTLRRVDGIVTGWGKHYRFCNDKNLFEKIDTDIKTSIGFYIGQYRDIRNKRAPTDAHELLGMQRLSTMERKPLLWPSKKTSS